MYQWRENGAAAQTRSAKENKIKTKYENNKQAYQHRRRNEIVASKAAWRGIESMA
jgi:hypothetical protein